MIANICYGWMVWKLFFMCCLMCRSFYFRCCFIEDAMMKTHESLLFEIQMRNTLFSLEWATLIVNGVSLLFFPLLFNSFPDGQFFFLFLCAVLPFLPVSLSYDSFPAETLKPFGLLVHLFCFFCLPLRGPFSADISDRSVWIGMSVWCSDGWLSVLLYFLTALVCSVG